MLVYILLLVSVGIIAALMVYVLYLRAQVYDLRWNQAKVFPLLVQAASEDPDEREYLDPESLEAFARGEISIDDVVVLSKQQAVHQP